VSTLVHARSRAPAAAARRTAAFLFGVLALAWGRDSQATPTFPAVVQSYYGLSSVPIDPPQGCRLCHVDDIGGTPTTLRPFGRMLYTQFGVVPYDDQSLRSALMALDSQYPIAAAEIKSGADPNTAEAPAVDAGAGGGGSRVGGDPVPYYGCAIHARANAAAGGWPIGALLALVALRRRKVYFLQTRHASAARQKFRRYASANQS
jgi:hypothetical protein